MRIAIAGSSGFIGTALRRSLNDDGHEVVRLVRREPSGKDERRWNPYQRELDPAVFDGVEAVVNLCGVNVGQRRWTRHFKDEIYQSRVLSTQVLANTLAQLDEPPRVFVSISAVGYYGPDRRNDYLDEDSSPGSGFLARVCADWEAAAQPARDAGIAVANPRFGIVVDHSGGALARMLPIFRMGLGGPLSRGSQYWSFVSLVDAVRAFRFLIEEHGNVGPFNVATPEPVTNAEFSRALGKALGRPALVRVPATALHIAFGDYADELLGSLRAVPKRLVEARFEFEHPDLPSVLSAALRR